MKPLHKSNLVRLIVLLAALVVGQVVSRYLPPWAASIVADEVVSALVGLAAVAAASIGIKLKADDRARLKAAVEQALAGPSRVLTASDLMTIAEAQRKQAANAREAMRGVVRAAAARKAQAAKKGGAGLALLLLSSGCSTAIAERCRAVIVDHPTLPRPAGDVLVSCKHRCTVVERVPDGLLCDGERVVGEVQP